MTDKGCTCGYAIGHPLVPVCKCKKWADLTKDEVDSWDLPDSPTVYEFAQFVEAKLKEKNT